MARTFLSLQRTNYYASAILGTNLLFFTALFQTESSPVTVLVGTLQIYAP